MGWFDGRSSSSSHYVVRRRSPPRRSGSGVYSSHHSRHSAPSIFNLGGLTSGRNKSTSSLFSSSSSSRRARPRSGFIQRVIHSIKRLFRDIYYYARRHPMKVFLLVIVPLLTSGVLAKLLAVVGVRLPKGLFGDSVGQSSRGGYGELGGGSGGVGDSVNSLMNIAKMFM